MFDRMTRAMNRICLIVLSVMVSFSVALTVKKDLNRDQLKNLRIKRIKRTIFFVIQRPQPVFIINPPPNSNGGVGGPSQTATSAPPASDAPVTDGPPVAETTQSETEMVTEAPAATGRLRDQRPNRKSRRKSARRAVRTTTVRSTTSFSHEDSDEEEEDDLEETIQGAVSTPKSPEVTERLFIESPKVPERKPQQSVDREANPVLIVYDNDLVTTTINYIHLLLEQQRNRPTVPELGTGINFRTKTYCIRDGKKVHCSLRG
ncbi:hypothetical protein HDE_11610 [Halotydeus destructor]|nr:hypothetical protein HDE_11610 [Halotydeus destructor]